VEELTKLLVAGNAALPDAHDVHRGEVDRPRSVGALEVLEELRVVVQRDQPRMSAAERVQAGGHTELEQHLTRVERSQLGKVTRVHRLTVLEREERELVRQERVHPVDRHELLGQRVGDAVVVGR
jgi:hypothetical protein